MARKIILDVDTGSDDAVAIMTAILSPEIELEAICSVAGNQPIDNTTENSLRVVQLLGADVPVYRGCSQPLVKMMFAGRMKLKEAPVIVDGKEIQMHPPLLDIPASKTKECDMPAAMFYVDYLRKAVEPVTLVAVGPLTNLAVALMIDGGIVKNIEEIVIMGGGCNVTNVTAAAEFNIWYDPEAAQKVLDCGAKITLVPLDATHAACVTKDDCERFRKIGTKAAVFAAEMCEHRIIMHNARQPLAVPDAAAVHDALAVCYLIDSTVLRDVRLCHVEIDVLGAGEGQTIVDKRFYPKKENAYFAFDGDRFKFADILCKTFALGN